MTILRIGSGTVREELKSAELNIENAQFTGPSVRRLLLQVALSQLHDAAVLLEKGWSLDTLVAPLLERYGTVEDVPEYHVGRGQDNGE